MAVMAVELGASRLLAPYFSSSQIVWTIIIGTIMIAMALGNVWSGRQADKDPNPDKLYFRLIIASVWIAAIPLLGKYIILGISGILVLTVNTNFLIWAAFNTIGSIVGTFLPTFVTIPAVGTAVTFFIFSGVLLLLALIYFICTKTKKVPCIVGVIAFIICSIFGHSTSITIILVPICFLI